MDIEFDSRKVTCKNCGMFVFNGSVLQSYGRMPKGDTNDEFHKKTGDILKKFNEKKLKPEEYAKEMDGLKLDMEMFCPVCGKVHNVQCVNVTVPKDKINAFIKGEGDPLAEYGLSSSLLPREPNVELDQVVLVSTDSTADDSKEIPGYWMFGAGFQLINSASARVEYEDSNIKAKVEKSESLTPQEEQVSKISADDRVLRSIWYVYDKYDDVMDQTIDSMQNDKSEGKGTDSKITLTDEEPKEILVD